MRLSGLIFAIMLMLLSFTFGCATATVTRTDSPVEASPPVLDSKYEILDRERLPVGGITLTTVRVKGTSTILYVASAESYTNGSTITSISIAAR